MAKEQVELLTRSDLRSTSFTGRLHDSLPIEFIGALPYDLRKEGEVLARFVREFLEIYPESENEALKKEMRKYLGKVKKWHKITSR